MLQDYTESKATSLKVLTSYKSKKIEIEDSEDTTTEDSFWV